jgi:hypothetical protein
MGAAAVLGLIGGVLCAAVVAGCSSAPQPASHGPATPAPEWVPFDTSGASHAATPPLALDATDDPSRAYADAGAIVVFIEQLEDVAITSPRDDELALQVATACLMRPGRPSLSAVGITADDIARAPVLGEYLAAGDRMCDLAARRKGGRVRDAIRELRALLPALKDLAGAGTGY